jgi:hypothetical protein
MGYLLSLLRHLRASWRGYTIVQRGGNDVPDATFHAVLGPREDSRVIGHFPLAAFEASLLPARQARFKRPWTFWRGCLPLNPSFRPARGTGSLEGLRGHQNASAQLMYARAKPRCLRERAPALPTPAHRSGLTRRIPSPKSSGPAHRNPRRIADLALLEPVAGAPGEPDALGCCAVRCDQGRGARTRRRGRRSSPMMYYTSGAA